MGRYDDVCVCLFVCMIWCSYRQQVQVECQVAVSYFAFDVIISNPFVSTLSFSSNSCFILEKLIFHTSR